MKKNIFLLLFSLFFQIVIFAQEEEKNEFELVFEKVAKLKEEEKYKEAIEELEKIPSDNSYYDEAVMEKLDCFYYDKNYEKSIEIAKNLLKNNKKNEIIDPKIYIYLGNSLSSLNNLKEAEICFEDGIKKYSYNYLLYFNYAIVLNKQEKTQETIDAITKSIELNPYFPSSHLLLYNLASKHGNLYESIYPCITFLLLQPDNEKAQAAIIDLEKTLTKKFNENDEKKQFSKIPEDYSKIEKILRSQIALSDKYNNGTEFAFPVIKQIHAFLFYLKEHKSNGGFFDTIYYEFYNSLINNKYFTTYINYIFSELNNEKVQKVVKSDKKNIEQFVTWTVSNFDLFAKRKINNKSVIYEYNDERKLRLIGEKVNNLKENIFKYIDDYGAEAGFYNYKNDLLNGPYQVNYSNGIKKIEGNFKDDQYDGKFTYYNSDGFKEKSLFAKNGEMDGREEYYFENADQEVSAYYNYVNKIKKGDSKIYYSNGQVKSEVVFDKDFLNGKLTRYYPNGQIRADEVFVDDELNGEIKNYYANGKIQSIENYTKGILNGKSINYYPDGKVRSETIVDNGNYNNPVTKYFPDGSLEEINSFNKKGNLNGKTELFSPNNVKNYDLVYKNGKLYSVDYYKNNKIIESKKLKSKDIFIFKDENDNILSKGIYENYDRTGEWQFFNRSGILLSKANYNEGSYNGKSIFYHLNGKISKEYNYVNNQLDGKLIEYNIEGVKESEGEYKNDIKVNYTYFYNSKGEITDKYYHQDETLNGKRYIYNDNNEIETIQTYKDDELLNEEFYFNNQKIDSLNYTLHKGLKIIKKTNYDTIELNIKNSLKNGKYYYKENNNLLTEINYIDNKKYGKYISYSNLNKVFVECNYLNDNLYGEYKTYDLHGNLKYISFYIDNEEYDKETRYFYNGNIEYTKENKNGAIFGDVTYYGENNQPLLKLNYFNDEIQYYELLQAKDKSKVLVTNGKAKIIANYANGNKGIEIEFLGDKIHGNYNIYQSNGTPIKKSSYVFGEIDGERSSYYTNGNIYLKENFKLNNHDGITELFYENGMLKASLNYKNDNLNGDLKEYNIKGEITKHKIYLNNDLQSIKK